MHWGFGLLSCADHPSCSIFHSDVSRNLSRLDDIQVDVDWTGRKLTLGGQRKENSGALYIDAKQKNPGEGF